MPDNKILFSRPYYQGLGLGLETWWPRSCNCNCNCKYDKLYSTVGLGLETWWPRSWSQAFFEGLDRKSVNMYCIYKYCNKISVPYGERFQSKCAMVQKILGSTAPGSGVANVWCPLPFPSPSISRCFSIHSSSPATEFHSCFFFTIDVSAHIRSTLLLLTL